MTSRSHHCAAATGCALSLCLAVSPTRAQNCILRWDPAFANPGINGVVRALHVYDDGTGPGLFAAGYFTAVNGGAVPASRIARWNGTSWTALGSGIGGAGTPELFALEVWNNRLYVGGSFSIAGSTSASRIASWNGTTWADVGGGANSTVFALAGTETASAIGPALYAGGNMYNAGSTNNVNGIAKWNGVTWSRLGSGMLAVDGTVGTVFTLLVSNGVLYAGGAFNRADGMTVNYIAQWNGTTWASVGSGMSGVVAPSVYALTMFNGELIAGGNFENAGGTPVRYVARWNGTTWAGLGTGLFGAVPNLREVRALTVWDNGQGGGPALYAGGQFITAGGLVANYIAQWNGTNWSPMPPSGTPGMNAGVTALCPYNHGHNALFVGGLFTTAGGRTSEHIGKWWCIPLLPEACCMPDGTCQDVNFNQCTALGGQAHGQATACASTQCPVPPQACCSASGTCRDLLTNECTAQGGQPQGQGTTCTTTSCPATQGCCLLDGTCHDLLPTLCTAQGGMPWGPGTACGMNTCMSTQACCLANGACQERFTTDCTAAGGTPQGRGTICPTTSCTGACCLPDGSCLDLTVAQCATVAGGHLGLGTRCATRECTQRCCLPHGGCRDMLPSTCRAERGIPQTGTPCSFLPCPADCSGIRRGDFNGDDHLDGADIPWFVAELLSPDPPGAPDFCRANFVTSGNPEMLDQADVQAFVACLLDAGQCP